MIMYVYECKCLDQQITKTENTHTNTKAAHGHRIMVVNNTKLTLDMNVCLWATGVTQIRPAILVNEGFIQSSYNKNKE